MEIQNPDSRMGLAPGPMRKYHNPCVAGWSRSPGACRSQESSWLLSWGPCLWGLRGTWPWLLWMAQRNGGRPSLPFVLEDLKYFYQISCIMRTNIQQVTMMIKSKFKVLSRQVIAGVMGRTKQNWEPEDMSLSAREGLILMCGNPRSLWESHYLDIKSTCQNDTDLIMMLLKSAN